MSTIAMHIDALDLFGVDIAGNMITAIDNEAFLPKLFRFMSKNSTRKTCTYNKIIVLRHAVFSLMNRKRRITNSE